jgi:hypothetical protein
MGIIILISQITPVQTLLIVNPSFEVDVYLCWRALMINSRSNTANFAFSNSPTSLIIDCVWITAFLQRMSINWLDSIGPIRRADLLGGA